MVNTVYSFKERCFAEKRRNAIKVIMKAATYWIYIFSLYMQKKLTRILTADNKSSYICLAVFFEVCINSVLLTNEYYC